MKHSFILLICLLPMLGKAETMGTTSGGQECFAVNEWQAEAFEHRENGFWNVDPYNSYWVICPLSRPVLDHETEVRPCPAVNVTNRSTVDTEFSCYFRELNQAGSEISVIHGEQSVLSEGTAVLGCSHSYQIGFHPPKSFLNSYSVACLLPPDTGITRLQNWWIVGPTFQPDGPVLQFPINNEIIEQNNANIECDYNPTRGYGFAIEFEWSELDAHSVSYRLIVEHTGSTHPAVDMITEDSSYSWIQCNSFVAPHNLEEWVWRVQALVTATPLEREISSDWSEGRFQFEKCTLFDGSSCSAPASE